MRFLLILIVCMAASTGIAQDVDSCSAIWWNKKIKEIVEIKGTEIRKQTIVAAISNTKACGLWYQCINLSNGLTYLYFTQDRLDSAMIASKAVYELSRTHLSALGDTIFPAINALNDYGALQFYYGNPQKGITILEEAAQALEQSTKTSNIPDSRLQADLQRTFHNLAANYSKLGDYEEARRVLEKVITLKEGFEESTPEYLSPSYEELGNVYMKTEAYQDAKTWFEAALSIIKKASPPYPKREANYLYRIADAWFAMDSVAQAKQYALQSMAHPGASLQRENNLAILAKIALSQHEYEQAETYLNESLERTIANPTGKQTQIATLYQLTSESLLEQGRFYEAVDAINQGFFSLSGEKKQDTTLDFFPVEDSVIFPLVTIDMLGKKAALATRAFEMGFIKQSTLREHNIKAYDLALRICKKQIQSFRDERSKMFWADKMQDLVGKQIALQVQLLAKTQNLHYIDDAFEAAEMLKAAVLKEAVQDARVRTVSQPSSTLRGHIQTLELQNSMLKRRVQRLKQSQDTVTYDSLRNVQFATDRRLKLTEDSLRALMNESALTRTIGEDTRLEEIQAQLTEDQNLIQYITTDSLLFAFVLSARDKHVYSIPNSAQLKRDIQQYIDILHGTKEAEPSAIATYAQRLYSQLIAPLGTLHRRLIIVPDGMLFQLPFESLITELPDTDRFQDWPWLLHDHIISYTFSSGLWANQHPASTSDHWLGIAPVAFDSTLPQLRASEAELTQIASILKKQGYSNNIFLQHRASKRAFLHELKQPSNATGLLHFSTHASSNGTFPKDSWLAFSGEGDSARLYLDELYSLPLASAMVVLSACETQSGKVSKGEGVMSLARAFTYAGSNSVIATLWTTQEQASSIIMEQFYAQLAAGLPKDEALNLARIHYLKEAPVANDRLSPGYWAAFVATGDMSPVCEEPTWSWWWVLLGMVVAGVVVFVIGKK